MCADRSIRLGWSDMLLVLNVYLSAPHLVSLILFIVFTQWHAFFPMVLQWVVIFKFPSKFIPGQTNKYYLSFNHEILCDSEK